MLHDTVRRTFGHRAALLAALMLALTPVTVLMGRFDNPDALLVLLLVCAAWATVRAIETGRTRQLLLAGVLVGLAFNTKMLQAYLVLPALAVAYLYAGPGRVRRRLAQLLGAGAATLAVSAAWVSTMMLIPASQRPYVGDTVHNSWWELIFEANGLDRVGSSGIGGGPVGFGGGQGALRLFNVEVGGQIAWLLPLAALGLLVGLWVRRRAPRTDPARAAYVLWGIWALVHFVVFSFMLNLFHPYYTSALAPAIAVLAAGGLLALWDRIRVSRLAAAILAGALLATALLSIALLDRIPSFVPWLRWLVPAAAFACAAAILVWRTRPRVFVLVLALAVVLAAPAAYSLATVGRSVTGGNPEAGPAAAERAFPGGAASKRVIAYLEVHRDGAKYLVAASGSIAATPIVLATHQLVVTIGGFSGQDPAPTVVQLQRLVSSGQLRYVYGLGGARAPIGSFGRGGLAGGGFGLPGGASGSAPGGVTGSVPPAGGPPGGALPGGAFRGFPGGPSLLGHSDSGTQARQRWIAAHCKEVSGYPGLEDCSGAR